MSTTLQNLPTSTPAPEKISILIVSPYAEDSTAMREIFHNSGWIIDRTAGAREAASYLTQRVPSIVICERDLPDGNWKDLLQKSDCFDEAPLMLVTSRNADEGLWAEVLNLGGYDVLVKPFDRSEVTRVVSMASRRWFGSWAGRRREADTIQ